MIQTQNQEDSVSITRGFRLKTMQGESVSITRRFRLKTMQEGSLNYRRIQSSEHKDSAHQQEGSISATEGLRQHSRMIKPPNHKNSASNVLHGRRPQTYTTERLRFTAEALSPTTGGLNKRCMKTKPSQKKDQSSTRGGPSLQNRKVKPSQQEN
jgi:hypothetical protein